MPDRELWKPKPQESSSQEHTLFPQELAALPIDERLTTKLEAIMRDPDLALELGVYIRDLALPGLVKNTITQEQADRVWKAYGETLDAMMTPEMRSDVEEALRHELWAEKQGRRKESEFARW